jgi:uncharacterized protein HemX
VFIVIHFLKSFAKNDAGAIAVDWLLLTATAIGLAIGGFSMLQDKSASASNDPAKSESDSAQGLD